MNHVLTCNPDRVAEAMATWGPALNDADADGIAVAPACARPLRLLTFSTLFPNRAQPVHGVFVENRLRHVVASGAAEARVIAPVPWFPSSHPRFGAYGTFAKVPPAEERFGLAVVHPRYLVVPKVGMTLSPFTLFAAARPAVARLLAAGYDFDLIDAHYIYPDGVAAVLLARHFRKPVTLTARGTDINLVPRYRLPRTLIRWACARADGLICVCQALKDELVALGVAADRIRVLRNGVDLALFRPTDPAPVRARLGISGPILLSVGGLIERKGHDLIIRALPRLPAASLVIAGDGPERDALAALARSLGVADRVRLLGAVPHGELPGLYSAASALVLASSREGWANVLLEAMACGTPVIASNVWGTPEVVAAPEAGLLLRERSADAIADAIQALLADPPDRRRTRTYAERFSWDDTTAGQIQLFRAIVAKRAGFERKGQR